MKNCIEIFLADCIKFIGSGPAFTLCCLAKRRLSVKNNFLFFYAAVKVNAKKIATGYYKILSFSILFMLLMPGIKAQQDLNYAVHANIIYRFTKYIDWPSSNNTGDFVIGIVGDSPLFLEMEGFIANKTVGNRRIVVKKMSASADYYNCHILFISEGKSKSLKKIAAITKGSPILIVSETGNDPFLGSCINFVIVNEHLKLEINKTNIDNRNLNIASELLRLGTIVK